jgi:micrococcal nuclease
MFTRLVSYFRQNDYIVENANNKINKHIMDNKINEKDEKDNNNIDNEWLNNPIDIKNTLLFVPPIEKGVVIKVYDGDTITIASKLPYNESPIYRFSVRINGIDCPEIKSKDENEKECAIIARETIEHLLLNQIVSLQNIQHEKYGRILADVYIGDFNVGNYLLEQRLAVSYDGGTKISPTNWMNYYIKGEL